MHRVRDSDWTWSRITLSSIQDELRARLRHVRMVVAISSILLVATMAFSSEVMGRDLGKKGPILRTSGRVRVSVTLGDYAPPRQTKDRGSRSAPPHWHTSG